MNGDLPEGEAVPLAPLDVSAYTDEDGVVHFTVRDGGRVYEVKGSATAVLEQRFAEPVEVRSELGDFSYRPPRSEWLFTFRIADAKTTVQAASARAAGGES